MSSEVVAAITCWCAAICTFAILSVLYRENRFYRLFEHIFIGVATGFGLFATWNEVLKPAWWEPMVTEGKLALSDGEQAADWEGVTEMHVKEGPSAIRWDLAKTPVLSTRPAQTDWSKVQYVRFWLYSENAAGATIHLAMQSAEGEGKGGTEGNRRGNEEIRQLGNRETGELSSQPQPPEPNFLISQLPSAWVAELPIDFMGWQQVLLHRSAFWPEGQPDWASIRQVRFVLAGDAPPGAALHVDEFLTFTERQRLVREGRINVSTAARPARWAGRTEAAEVAGRRGVRWSGKEISTEDVRQKDWATLQYLHLWLYADQPQEGSVQVTLHSQFEDKEGEQDEEGKYPLKEGTFQATLPLPPPSPPHTGGSEGGNGHRAVPAWQECVLHRTRFTPEGDASWQHVVRLSLSRSTKGGKEEEGTEGKEGEIGNLYVGDIVAYTGRTRWTLAGKTVVSNCDDAAAWSGATANYVKEKEGSLRWLPAETPEIGSVKKALPQENWSQYRYLRFWARLLPSPASETTKPDGGRGTTDLTLTVTVHTEKQEDAKDEPRGEEKWTKVGTFSGMLQVNRSEWAPYQISLPRSGKRNDGIAMGRAADGGPIYPQIRFGSLFYIDQGEPDWKGVQRVTLSVPKGQVPAGTVICLDDLSLYSGRKWYWAMALVAGLMFYTVYSKRYVWFSRLIIAVLWMGLGAGAAFKGFVTEMFPQVSSSFKPLWGNHLSPLDIFNNLVFILTLLCVLMYFFFSFEHKHTVVRGSARMGRWLLMICFGVIFGNTVMGRMSLFIERLMFLLHDWWPHVIGKG